MEQSERSIDDLLSAIESAPTFGMNARELILQASRRIATQVYAIFAFCRSLRSSKFCPLVLLSTMPTSPRF